jgi:hypothetical protein
MAEPKPVDYAIAIPTFIGSLLSCLGSAIALAFQIARPPRRHFRHSLIVNLLVADFIYGLGNTISGAIFISNGRTPSPLAEPSTACLVSGWFSQANAQHIDFNILIISIVVLFSVIKKDAISHLGMKWEILICAAAWVPGIITGTIGLTLDSYGYVSGNWCWIRSDRLDLRYGLSHAWRIIIFVATIAIYTYIFATLKRIFINNRNLSSISTTLFTRTGQDNQGAGSTDPDNDTQKILVDQSVSVSHEMHNMPHTPDTADRDHSFNRDDGAASTTVRIEGTATNRNTTFEPSRMPAPPNVRKMLLMNGYPVAYVILWIPGIANRLAESVGQSPRWLNALQATTQYIGLINALTYGMSEQMRRGVWKKIKDPRGRGGA